MSRKSCSIFGDNLTSNCIAQILLGLCRQSAVNLCQQILLAEHKLNADAVDATICHNILFESARKLPADCQYFASWKILLLLTYVNLRQFICNK